jgi:hypothetical protein
MAFKGLRFTLDGEVREIEWNSFRLSEADELRRFTGWSRNEWIDALFNDHPDAIRFAWWLGNKRNGTPIDGKLADIDFDLADFEVDAIEEPDEVPVDGAEGSDLPTGPPAE